MSTASLLKITELKISSNPLKNFTPFLYCGIVHYFVEPCLYTKETEITKLTVRRGDSTSTKVQQFINEYQNSYNAKICFDVHEDNYAFFKKSDQEIMDDNFIFVDTLFINPINDHIFCKVRYWWYELPLLSPLSPSKVIHEITASNQFYGSTIIKTFVKEDILKDRNSLFCTFTKDNIIFQSVKFNITFDAPKYTDRKISATKEDKSFSLIFLNHHPMVILYNITVEAKIPIISGYLALTSVSRSI